MPTDGARKSPANPMGRSFLLGYAGAAAGCLAVAVLAVSIFGSGGVLLLLLPPYLFLLIAAAVVAPCPVAVLTRFCPWRLRGGIIATMSGALTVGLFSIVPIHFYLINPDGRTGPLFG